jgi:hypothetical protein
VYVGCGVEREVGRGCARVQRGLLSGYVLCLLLLICMALIWLADALALQIGFELFLSCESHGLLAGWPGHASVPVQVGSWAGGVVLFVCAT